MANEVELGQRLADAVSSPDVERISDSSYRVVLPDLRYAHSEIVFGVTAVDGGWIISDAGQMSQLLEADFDRLVEVLNCTGASFSLSGNRLDWRVSESSDVVSSLTLFGHYLAAAPTVWHALECSKKAIKSETGTQQVARDTLSILVNRFGERSKPYMHLDHKVRWAGEIATVPLAIADPIVSTRATPSLPRVTINCFDALSKPAFLSQKKEAAFLRTMLTSAPRKPAQYFVVRGSDDDVEHIAELFDATDSGVVVPTTDLGGLYEDVESALQTV